MLKAMSIWTVLNQHQRRVFDEALDLAEESRSDGAINDAVVATDAEVHTEAGDDVAIFDDGFFNDSSHAENSGLGWVDDGVERFDAPRAEVGDGHGALS